MMSFSPVIVTQFVVSRFTWLSLDSRRAYSRPIETLSNLPVSRELRALFVSRLRIHHCLVCDEGKMREVSNKSIPC